MSRLTATAEGVIGQLLFVVLAVIGSRGAIKAGLPLVDDEGRDVEIHLGGEFRPAFAVQVKTSAVLRRPGNVRLLRMTFTLPRADQIDHPCYWYLFVYLDKRQMRLADWVFLVPSSLVHAHCISGRNRDQPLFYFQASMEASANDQWAPYRLKPEDLGRRLMELMRDAPRGFAESDAFTMLGRLPGLCFLGTPSATRLPMVESKQMPTVPEIPVSEHLKKIPSSVRPIFKAARRTVKAVAPQATEIGYRSQPPRSTPYMWKIVRYAVAGANVVGIGTFPGTLRWSSIAAASSTMGADFSRALERTPDS